MIDCFLANFRINPHNNDTLKVCLNTGSPSLYHHVLVSALYRIITQSRLPWWPQIDMLYSKSQVWYTHLNRHGSIQFLSRNCEQCSRRLSTVSLKATCNTRQSR